MKNNSIKYNITRSPLRKRVITGLASLAGLSSLFVWSAPAASADRFAASSRLAEGKWVKIAVDKTGMQYIPDAVLTQMGFSDPKKVRVYGFGGRMLSENLSPSNPDDLPEQPSGRTPSGLYFFGTDSFDIQRQTKGNDMMWKHIMNPYSEASYYFLSDVESQPLTMQTVGTPGAELTPVTSFTAHLVHEQDIFAPSTTGRNLLGEDFRSQPNQSYSFTLTDNADGAARFNVVAASVVTNGSSTFGFTVNGATLPTQSSDRIQSVTSENQFMRTAEMIHKVEGVGNSLKLDIKHSLTGVSKMTRLDYIEVEYERALALPASEKELYFYTVLSGKTSFSISNIDKNSTEIWDVTDPMNPGKVDYSVSGNNAQFTVDGVGPRYFVAFSPMEFSNRPVKVGNVSNQNLHALPAPDYLIITPSEYRSQAEAVANLHREIDGMTVEVIEPELIYNEFSSGNPDVTAFRKLLKMWNFRAEENEEATATKYCLVFSRPTYDNKMKTEVVRGAGYPRIPIWQSLDGMTETTSYSTDDYIGMLDDSVNQNFNISSAKIHVGVGRMPIKSVTEANVLVNKLTDYMKNPNLGSWRNTVMLIADDQDNGVHLDQAENVYKRMRSKGNGDKFLYERLYLDSYPLGYGATGAAYPEAKKRMFDKWKEGVMMIDYIGHASTRSWSHEGLMTWNDILNMSNPNLPFLYAATCEFGRHDDDSASGAEELVINPAGGVIATIVPSRTVYISQNGTLSNSTASILFERGEDGKAKRLGDILREGKNGYGPADDNKLRYSLIGDPALRLLSPDMEVVVSEIAGTSIEDTSEDIPVIGARTQADITGYIANPDGTVAEDFNGIVYLNLFDAEKVIETYGNGDAGKVSTYNDRKTRLFTGRTKVENGRWSVKTFVPYEIENNYSPALISLYAYDEKGREANGATEKLYVYGFDENAVDDADGPEISAFYLNNESFRNGQTTHNSPLVIGSFNDPSGINISDAGIGHKITLTLDGTKSFEDIGSYYLPDLENPNGGSFAYPLSDLKPGSHTLELRVWDTANNSSLRKIDFQVGVNVNPEIFDVNCTGSTRGEAAIFTVMTDRPMARLKCSIEVFALDGKKIWSSESEQGVGQDSSLTVKWDLKDSAGRRVPRGIYVYRAGVTTPEGTSSFKSKKLAVSAEGSSN